MKNKTFHITAEHMSLVSHLCFTFEGHYPTVCSEYPFGDSSVYDSMGKILGVPKLPENDYEFTERDYEHFQKLLEEMTTVLQIGVRVGYFREGTYEASEYGSNWREVNA